MTKPVIVYVGDDGRYTIRVEFVRFVHDWSAWPRQLR